MPACMHMYIFMCVQTCRSLFMCVVCMCVYSSLPLEGELSLLLDRRTLGRKLAQQDERILQEPRRSRAYHGWGGPATL